VSVASLKLYFFCLAVFACPLFLFLPGMYPFIQVVMGICAVVACMYRRERADVSPLASIRGSIPNRSPPWCLTDTQAAAQQDSVALISRGLVA
jgi:hypothetical protein